MRFTPATYASLYLEAARNTKFSELKVISGRFWYLVWRHRHWSWRRKIVTQVERLWREQEGVTGVELATAKLLSEAATAKLRRGLETALGQKVELNVSLKPHLLAGLVLMVGDRRYDASLKGRIDSLYHALAGTER